MFEEIERDVICTVVLVFLFTPAIVFSEEGGNVLPNSHFRISTAVSGNSGAVNFAENLV